MTETAIQILLSGSKMLQYLFLSLAFGYLLTLALFQPGAGRKSAGKNHGAETVKKAHHQKSPALTNTQKHLSKRGSIYSFGYLLGIILTFFSSFLLANRGQFDTAALSYFYSSTDLGAIYTVAGVCATGCSNFCPH